MKSLHLNKTQITEQGLLKLLQSTSQSLKVRTISFEDCNIDLTASNG